MKYAGVCNVYSVMLYNLHAESRVTSYVRHSNTTIIKRPKCGIRLNSTIICLNIFKHELLKYFTDYFVNTIHVNISFMVTVNLEPGSTVHGDSGMLFHCYRIYHAHLLDPG